MRGSIAFAALWPLCSLFAAAEHNATVVFGEQQLTSKEQHSDRLDAYLSELKRKAFGYDYAKTDAESKKLRDSWIRPVTVSYTLTRQNPYNGQGAPETQQESASIAIDQPLFQSGGIYYGIRYAEAAWDVGKLSIEQSERSLIKQAVSLLMQIKKAEIGIEKQQLQVANAKINLQQKREQYESGQLDSGFLNNAVIQYNLAKQTLIDLETAKARLVSSFESISDLDYHTAKIPFLAIVDKQRFMQETIDLKLAQRKREQDRYNKDVTMAKYLPSINLQGSYNWQKQQGFFFVNSTPVKSDSPETAYYRYGLRASMPLDFNSGRDYEAAKVAYLKSEVVIDDTRRSLRALYDQVMQNLKNFDAKIALAKENEALYAELLSDTQEQFRAGFKTQYDVDLLANSEKIEQLNQRSYTIDRQLELLDLYEKLSAPQ